MPRKKGRKKKEKKVKSSRGRKKHYLISHFSDIYKKINQVQVDKELIYIFFTDESLSRTAENVLKDSGVEFEIIERQVPRKIIFKLIPNIEENVMDDIDPEVFDDEIVEEGFLF
jgi:hypothetical protein